MCVESNMLLHLPLNTFSFYAFVFGATLAQYNLHYYVKRKAVPGSDRFIWSASHMKVHATFFVIGGLTICISVFFLHTSHIMALFVMCLISLLYSLPILPFKNKKRIKDFGLLKIITLSLLWTLVTVWFPLVESNYPIISFQLIFIRRFLFIFVLCLMFDIRDVEVDGQTGINTVPVITGIKKSIQIAYILLVVFVLISLIENMLNPDWKQLASMIISALITAILIAKKGKKHNDLYYLAGIDGMMLVQAFLVAIFNRF